MWVTRPKKTQSVRINVIINNDKFTNIFIKIILINYTGTISKAEAREALRKHKGNIWASVTECVEGRQQKVVILMTMLVVTIMSMRLVVIMIGFMNNEDMLIVPAVSCISRQYLTMTSLQ